MRPLLVSRCLSALTVLALACFGAAVGSPGLAAPMTAQPADTTAGPSVAPDAMSASERLAASEKATETLDAPVGEELVGPRAQPSPSPIPGLLEALPNVERARRGLIAAARDPGDGVRPPEESLLGNFLAARVARRRRDMERAASYYERALLLAPRDEQLLKSTFFSNAARGKWDDAGRQADAILEADADDRLSLLYLGADAFIQADWQGAKKRFSKANSGPIGKLTSVLALSWIETAQGNSKAAFAALANLDQDWARFYREYHRALMADVLGLSNLAETTWAGLFKEEPATLRVALGYARHLSALGRNEEALTVLNKHIRATRGSDSVAQTMRLALRDGLKLDFLVKDAQSGLAEVFFGLGEALAGEGGVDIGTVYLQFSLLLDSNRDVARYGLANVYESTRRFDSAVDAYAKIDTVSPYAFDAALRRSFTLRVMERDADAIAQLEGMLERSALPARSGTVGDDTDGDGAGGDAGTAVTATAATDNAADNADPDDAQSSSQSGAPQGEAVATAAADAGGLPSDVRARIRMAQEFLAKLGAYEGSYDGIAGPATRRSVRAFQKEEGLDVDGVVGPQTLRALRAAVRIDDDTVLRDRRRRILLALGNALRGTKAFDKAATRYTQAINLIERPTKEHWNYFYARGVCYERLGRWSEAEVDFKKSLELDPDQPLVLNYLGYSWVDQNMNLAEAMELIRKAVRLKPNDGYFVDSLGWAYYRQNKFKQAVQYLERAVELRPEDPVINDHLGDAYWRVGRKLEARYQWDQALTLEPEDKEIPKIKAKLLKGLAPVDGPVTKQASADGTTEGEAQPTASPPSRKKPVTSDN